MDHQTELIAAQDKQIVSVGLAELVRTWVPLSLSVLAVVLTGTTAVVSTALKTRELDARVGALEVVVYKDRAAALNSLEDRLIRIETNQGYIMEKLNKHLDEQEKY